MQPPPPPNRLVAALFFCGASSLLGADWPTYMHDDERTGVTAERLSLPLSLQWGHHMRHPPAPAWPPPAAQNFWAEKTDLAARVVYDRACHVVAADGRIYFGSSADDKITCLDLATGRTEWTFFAEGPVRLAPAVIGRRVYVGSDDGFVYCLDAADGSLVWKLQAAPRARRIPGNGRMISAWPVRSGVVVRGGQARFACGLFPKQGTYQFIVDAETGQQLSRAGITFSPQGYMRTQGDRLLASTGRVPNGAELAQIEGPPSVDKTPGPAPDAYPYSLIGADTLRFAGSDGRVAAFEADGQTAVWQADVEGRAYSLAVADGRLLVSTDAGMIYCFAPGMSGAVDEAQAVEPMSYPSDQVREFYESAARRILDAATSDKGYCLVLDSQQGYLVYELARQSRFQVIGVEDDPANVAASRDALDRAGLYGRAVIHLADSRRLPYGDRLMNLVTADGTADHDVAEVVRVLRPEGGVAVLRQPKSESLGTNWKLSDDGAWATLRRGPLPGIGRWTHLYANPANTASSGDKLVAGPFALQWFGRPGPRQMVDRHHRTMSPLSLDGRLFVPGNNHVFALDAYNGTLLWDRPVPGSRRIAVARDCGAMAVAGDRLYVVAGGECLAMDGASGRTAATFEVPPVGDSPHDWGYLACVADRLFGSGVKPGASRRDHSRAAIDGAYYDRRPVVTSEYLFCCDRHDGRTLWVYDQNVGAIVNSTIAVGGGRVFFVESDNRQAPDGRATLPDLLAGDARLVALDAESGQVAWRRPVGLDALEHTIHLSYAEDRVFVVGSRNGGAQLARLWYDVWAFDASDGKPLWSESVDTEKGLGGSHGEQDHHPVIVGERIYVESFAFETGSGERVADWRWNRAGGGCGTLSASALSLFFRGTNPSECGFETGRTEQINTVSRPGCWINIIPAGGLLLIPEASSGCTCNYAIQGSMAYVPESSFLSQ